MSMHYVRILFTDQQREKRCQFEQQQRRPQEEEEFEASEEEEEEADEDRIVVGL